MCNLKRTVSFSELLTNFLQQLSEPWSRSDNRHERVYIITALKIRGKKPPCSKWKIFPHYLGNNQRVNDFYIWIIHVHINVYSTNLTFWKSNMPIDFTLSIFIEMLSIRYYLSKNNDNKNKGLIQIRHCCKYFISKNII